MEKLLWQASEKRRKQSNLVKYHSYLKKSYSINFDYEYDSLFNWSIAKPNLFWTSLLSYLDINYRSKVTEFLDELGLDRPVDLRKALANNFKYGIEPIK